MEDGLDARLERGKAAGEEHREAARVRHRPLHRLDLSEDALVLGSFNTWQPRIGRCF